MRVACVLAPSLAVIFAMTTSVFAAETSTYTYDALGRLVSSANVGGPRATTPTTTGYDPAGNRSIQSVGPTGSTSNAASVSVSAAPAVDGGQSAIFTLTKSGAAASALSVNYATASGSAVAPTDYAATSGTATFLAWETVKTIAVATVARNSVPARQFSLSLSAPTAGLTIGTASGVATINAQGAANQPPVANFDAAGNIGICLNKLVNVLGNDTDPEGNYPLTLVSVTSSPLADATVTTAAEITITAFGTPGSGNVTYTVADSLGATSTGTVTFTIVNGLGCSRPQPGM
jgi:YD repeat-containing protein